MFALPNSLSHVSSAAFAQAGLRLGSGSAQVCSGLLRSAHPYLCDVAQPNTNLCRIYRLLTRSIFGLPSSQRSQICSHCTKRTRIDTISRGCFCPPILKLTFFTNLSESPFHPFPLSHFFSHSHSHAPSHSSSHTYYSRPVIPSSDS